MLFLTLRAELLSPLDGIPRFVRSQATKFSHVRLSKNAIPMQWIGRGIRQRRAPDLREDTIPSRIEDPALRFGC